MKLRARVGAGSGLAAGVMVYRGSLKNIHKKFRVFLGRVGMTIASSVDVEWATEKAAWINSGRPR